MMKNLITFFILLSGITLSAQLTRYSFAEADRRSAENPKPFVIVFSAPWCKICGMMDATTLKDPEIIETLNNDFYFIAFSSDNEEPQSFNGQNYVFIPTGNGNGIHEITEELLKDMQIIYPTIIVLGIDRNILYRGQSFLDSKNMMALLAAFKG